MKRTEFEGTKLSESIGLKRQFQRLLSQTGYSLHKVPVKEAVGSTQGSRRTGLVEKWDIEENFITSFDALDGIAGSTWQGYYSLWQAVAYVEQHAIPGAIVECGVELGAGLVTIGNALGACGSTDRQVFGFDTFAGMPEPKTIDHMSDGVQASKVMAAYPMRDGIRDFCYGSFEEVKHAIQTRTLYPMDRYTLVKGQVEETVPNEAPNCIALLRLDTDWYESTLHELRHLYPSLSPGGVIMIDDYGTWRGAREATEEYFEGKTRPLFVLDSPDRSRIGIKPYSTVGP